MKIVKKQIIIELSVCILVFFLCFSFISPSINPFIFSFIIALTLNGFNIYYSSISLLLGLFLKMQSISSLVISINVIAIILLYKMLLSLKFIKIKTLLGYLMLLFSQVAFIYFNLYSKTSVISVIVSVVASLLFLYVYNIFFSAIKIKNYKGVYSVDEKICIFVSLITICMGISNIYTGSFFIIFPICLLFLYLASLTLKERDVLIIATLFSISIALTNNSVLPFAIIFIWATASIVFAKINKYAMVIATIITDIILGCVFNAYISYTYINLLMIFIPSLVILIIPNSKFEQISVFFGQNQQNIAKNFIISQNYTTLSKKLNYMSSLFCDLENLYKSMLALSLPQEKLVDFLYQQLKNKQCKNCGYNSEETCKAKDNLKEIISIALSKGKVTLVDLPSNFNLSCPFINQIIAQINDATNEYLKVKGKIDEQNSNLVALSESCAGMSEISKNFAQNLNGLTVNTNIKSSDIIAEFSVYNLQVKEVSVLKDDKSNIKKIILILRQECAKNSQYSQILSNIFKMKFIATSNEYTNFAGWRAVTFEIAPKFNVFVGFSQKSKQNDCGDNMLYNKLDNEKHILALADGMGTGKIASDKSNLCLDLLLSFINLGINRELMLSTINNLMFKVNTNSFSTLDLVEFDGYSGRADFVKLASSASYVKQKETTIKVVPESLPIGIVDKINPTIVTHYLRAGDFVVLCSDGVVDAIGEDNLQEFINEERTANAQILAESIIEEASLKNANDDLTCCVLKINNYN